MSATGTDELRLKRLRALSDWERQLLLAYLDGRAPEHIDEWLAKRDRGVTGE